MRQRPLFLPLLGFLGSLAGTACGGVPFGEAPGDDGGEDASPETSTITIGPPDAGTRPSDAATDSTTSEPSDAGADSGDDRDAHAVDSGEDAHDAAPADSGLADTDSGCGSTEKLCGSSCVALTNPGTGCAGTSCAACDLPNATNVCGAGGECTVGTCNGGYQLCTIGSVTTCVAPDAVHGVFVSPSSVTTGCGSISAPCGTIASGIAAAQAGGKTIVYLDEGTYAEQVTLAAGITIEGGWTYTGGGVWSDAQCAGTANPSALAVIQPPSGDVTVTANDVTATLSTLTVRSIAAAAAGQSLYGIFATGTTNLTMNAVEISIAAGGTGSVGLTGTSPGNGCTATGPADGAGGAPATPIADPTVGGTYSITGYAPASGGPGNHGNPGDNGTVGGPGSSAVSDVCDGNTGTCNPGATVIGGTGTGGCGGSGGAPGLGGGGGGASIALFVWGATAHVTGGALASAAGGPGGAGGAGGAGVAGASGAVGTPGSATTCKTTIVGGNSECSATAPKSVAGGAAGGQGGTGSAGGAGASGSGGDSYGYYVGGGGTVTLSGITPACGSPGTSPGPIAGVSGSNGSGSCHD